MNKEERIKMIEEKLSLLKAFSKHSMNGIKCPKCLKFVPFSLKGETFKCPYTNCGADCSDAIETKHPKNISKRYLYSINEKYRGNFGSDKEVGENYIGSSKNPFEILSSQESFKNSYDIILKTIVMQKKTNGGTKKMPNKIAMYEAFEDVLLKYPQEMIDYITIGGQNGSLAIQPIIYQHFSDRLLKKLPLSFFAKGTRVYIDDPIDTRLYLFEGVRQFTNFLDHNLVLKKKNQYSIIDGDVVENKSNHFIGKLISTTNIHGKDLSNHIDSCNFISLKMKSDSVMVAGQDIVVRYYSINPSYTMGSMIHMQRIKKKISESVKRKLDNLGKQKVVL